jgi:hypothetical protein
MLLVAKDGESVVATWLVSITAGWISLIALLFSAFLCRWENFLLFFFFFF